MEDLRKSPDDYRTKEQPVKTTEMGSRCVVFTYYQGDINSVVDEHFSRALRNTKDPQDLSTKNRNDDFQKNTNNMMMDEFNWTKTYQANSSDRMTSPVLPPLTSPSEHYTSAVYQQHQQHHTQPSDLWHYHHFGPPSQVNAVYHHPSVSEFQMVPGPNGKCSSFLGLLQPERYPVPLPESVSKPDLLSSAAAGSSIPENLNQRTNSQTGLHPQDRRKEYFHGQERRKDLYFY
ncbi:transcription cofactor vestigial-like protein 1 [Bufo bufo]|uniref:transcription cofactor vestigial-like protein 1 n=1 Tax=Bufo bufo TaxID=8384 RepID=UPI001ABED39A|nr:transcription cofactor vestigial-like protein 1 [Bufo bufo]